MKSLLILIFGTLIAIFTSTILNFVDIISYADLLMLFIFLFCLYSKSSDFSLILVSLILGIVYDILIGRYQGYYSITFFLTAVALTYLKDKLLRKKFSAMFFVCFLFILLNAICKSVIVSLPNLHRLLSSHIIVANIRFISSNSIVLALALAITIKNIDCR